MITYKKPDSGLLETVLKIRREMLAIIYGKDEREFEGEFTRLSAARYRAADDEYAA